MDNPTHIMLTIHFCQLCRGHILSVLLFPKDHKKDGYQEIVLDMHSNIFDFSWDSFLLSEVILLVGIYQLFDTSFPKDRLKKSISRQFLFIVPVSLLLIESNQSNVTKTNLLVD
jgi:hypothetical protein